MEAKTVSREAFIGFVRGEVPYEELAGKEEVFFLPEEEYLPDLDDIYEALKNKERNKVSDEAFGRDWYTPLSMAYEGSLRWAVVPEGAVTYDGLPTDLSVLDTALKRD